MLVSEMVLLAMLVGSSGVARARRATAVNASQFVLGGPRSPPCAARLQFRRAARGLIAARAFQFASVQLGDHLAGFWRVSPSCARMFSTRPAVTRGERGTSSVSMVFLETEPSGKTLPEQELSVRMTPRENTQSFFHLAVNVTSLLARRNSRPGSERTKSGKLTSSLPGAVRGGLATASNLMAD